MGAAASSYEEIVYNAKVAAFMEKLEERTYHDHDGQRESMSSSDKYLLQKKLRSRIQDLEERYKQCNDRPERFALTLDQSICVEILDRLGYYNL